MLVPAAQRVLRIVDLRPGKPGRTGKPAIGEHAGIRVVRPDIEELPDRGPEPLQIGHRPAPQLFVGVERPPPPGFAPGEVLRDGGARATLGRRLPQHRAFPYRPRLVAVRHIAFHPRGQTSGRSPTHEPQRSPPASYSKTVRRLAPARQSAPAPRAEAPPCGPAHFRARGHDLAGGGRARYD